MARNEVTSKKIGTKASKLLRTSRSKAVKSVSASDLTQLPNRNKKRK